MYLKKSDRLMLIPAYGRIYKSQKAVLEAFAGNFDFRVCDQTDPLHGSYTNLEKLNKEGVEEVRVRFGPVRGNLNRYTNFNIPKLVAVIARSHNP